MCPSVHLLVSHSCTHSRSFLSVHFGDSAMRMLMQGTDDETQFHLKGSICLCENLSLSIPPSPFPSPSLSQFYLSILSVNFYLSLSLSHKNIKYLSVIFLTISVRPSVRLIASHSCTHSRRLCLSSYLFTSASLRRASDARD